MIWTGVSLKMGGAGLILLLAAIEDLRSKKVHNFFVIFAFICSLLLISIVDGGAGLIEGFLSLFVAVVAVLPFYILKVLGGGDLKLIAAVSLLLSWKILLAMLFASLLWGALLGVFQVVLKGQGKVMIQNLFLILMRQKPQPEQLHKIPYTIALFFGFLTSVSVKELL